MPTIVQYPTKNFGYPSGASGRQGHQPQLIVNHIIEGTKAGYLAWLSGPRNEDENSANFSVMRDGTIYQHVPLATAAWCNGRMAKPDLAVPLIKKCYVEGINPNLISVSIEHEGYTGKPFTEAQVAATIWLHKYILSQCPLIKADRLHIVGHYQIDSVNKSRCPGSAFPWVRLMKALQPPAPAPDPFPSGLCHPDVEAFLRANPQYGYPRKGLVTKDGYGNEMTFTTRTAKYPHGCVVIYRPYFKTIGKNPIRVTTWE